KLEAGPDGTKVAPDGTITWDVPKDWKGTESVIVTVSDSTGQEIFHTFTLAAPGAKPAARPANPNPGDLPPPVGAPGEGGLGGAPANPPADRPKAGGNPVRTPN